MNNIETMRDKLSGLDPVSVDIIDENHKHAGHAGARDGGGHYLLKIITPKFAGMTTMARHRMIYSALGEMMKRDIHALNIQAKTPDEV